MSCHLDIHVWGRGIIVSYTLFEGDGVLGSSSTAYILILFTVRKQT